MGANGETPEPIYSIPSDLDVTVSIDGTELTEETLTERLMMIGRGFISAWKAFPAPWTSRHSFFSTLPMRPSHTKRLPMNHPASSSALKIQTQKPITISEVYGADMVGGGTITAWLDSKVEVT
ncbi:MAG: hypothetical protein U0Z26_19615 [Anaerolineales bacterium]